jgi:hypothetical protein
MKKHPLCLFQGAVDILFHGAACVSLPGSSRAAFFSAGFAVEPGFLVSRLTRRMAGYVSTRRNQSVQQNLFEYNQFIIRFLIHVT